MDCREPKGSPRLAMQDACGRDHPAFCVGLASDVVVRVVELYQDVARLVVVEDSQGDAPDLVFFATVEALD